MIRRPPKSTRHDTLLPYTTLFRTSLYAVVRIGTKSCGFNNTAVVTEQAFGPEKNTTFEIGTKNEFLGGRVTINASAYYIDWKDLQLSVPSAIDRKSTRLNSSP